MAIVDKTTLKSYFETGDIPTESQYIDLIDSTYGSTRIENAATTTFYDTNLASYSDQAVIGSPQTGTNLILTVQADTGGTPADVFQIDGNGSLYNNDIEYLTKPSDRSIILASGFAAGKTAGDYNYLIGYGAGNNIVAGAAGNIGIGGFSTEQLTSGQYNLNIGFRAGSTLTSQDYSINIGSNAGRYNVTGAMLFIDSSAGRTDIATELTNSLIVGTFNATPSSQTLNINAFQTIYTDSAFAESLGLSIEQAGTGDAKMTFTLTGVKNYSMGIDNSTTNDDFILSHTTTLTTFPIMTVDGSSYDATFVADVIATDFVLSSDARLKENIKPLEVGIDGLNPVEFNFIGKDNKQYGFIAQDMNKTHSELVRHNENDYMAISENSIIAMLVKEVQELKKQINGS